MASRETVPIEKSILVVRGQRVILAADLAKIYGVETRVLNQAVKRNRERFPLDFTFRLTRDEARGIAASRSQAVILKRGENIKYLPSVFTEYGAIMAANVLNTQHAVRMSVYVVRAFIRLFSNPVNGWNGAPVLSDAKQNRRKAIERSERMERH